MKKSCVVVVIYGVCYTIWSVIWQAITGNFIYPVIDWFEAPAIAVGCVAILLIAVLVVGCVLCWTKNKLIECYQPKKKSEQGSEEEQADITEMP